MTPQRSQRRPGPLGRFGLLMSAVLVSSLAACSSGGDDRSGTNPTTATTVSTAGDATSSTATAGNTQRPAGCRPADLPRGTPLGDATLRWTAECIPFVRTPDERFAQLVDFPYEPRYAQVDGLRMAYVDAGPRDGQVVLLLHGEPTWSYLYRKMIPVLADAGYRVVAPDMIGMGRSDKPVQFSDYRYLHHVRWVGEFVQSLGLRDVTAFVQDWGSLIGLRVVADNPDVFARVVVANGRLPVLPAGFEPVVLPDPVVPNQQWRLPLRDDAPPIPVEHSPAVTDRFAQWVVFALAGTRLEAGEVVAALAQTEIPASQLAAYDAPFPERIYMTGVRVFPSLVNTLSEEPTNAAARAVFDQWTKPLLTLFGRRDPNLGTDAVQAEMRDRVPGARGQAHHAYPDAGHFVQEDEGADVARRVVAFMRANPLPG